MLCRAWASCRSAYTNSASDGNKPEASAKRYKVDLLAPFGPASKKKTGFNNGNRSGGNSQAATLTRQHSGGMTLAAFIT